MVAERVVKCDGCLEPLDEFGAHWGLDKFTDPTDEDEDEVPEDFDTEYMEHYHGFNCFMKKHERELLAELEGWRTDG